MTFGQDAASVQSTSCSVLGPFDGSGVTAWTFNGNATGLDGTSTYSFTLKYASPTQTKTYQTADHYYISDNISVTSTGKIYSVDFDSQDNTKERDGSAVTTLSSAGHGTIDLVLDSSDAPPAHASVHIAF